MLYFNRDLSETRLDKKVQNQKFFSTNSQLQTNERTLRFEGPLQAHSKEFPEDCIGSRGDGVVSKTQPALIQQTLKNKS